MDIYQNTKDIVLKSLNSKKDFKKIIQGELLNDIESKLIGVCCNYFFKHYFLYEFLTRKYLNNATNLLITEFGLSIYFLQSGKLKYDDIKANLKRVFKKNKEIYSDEIDSLLIEASKRDFKFSNYVKKNTIEYISVVFNLPNWFIKMIINQHGKDIAKEVFLSFKSKEKYKDIYDIVFENYKKVSNRNFYLYNDEDNYFYNYFVNSFKDKNNVLGIGVDSFGNHKKLIKDVGLKEKSIRLSELTPKQLIAVIGDNQDYFIYYPKSCNMKNLYINECNRIFEDTILIDNYILKSLDSLNEIKDYIDLNGNIIFLVDSINKKETSNIIEKFLKTNKDFVLEKEKFIFPNSFKKSIGYYAILKRETK